MNADERSLRGCERERVGSWRKKHLSRLPREHDRGSAFVHWTMAIDHRKTGWLSPQFHYEWKLVLLHTCARSELLCPAYVLMPDHMHFLWAGLNDEASDQCIAVEFFRKHPQRSLAPAEWQRQPFDNVLREHEREHGAIMACAYYIFENPVRAGLVSRWTDYTYAGCCISGYPNLDVRHPDHWDLFWRIYARVIRTPAPSAGASDDS